MASSVLAVGDPSRETTRRALVPGMFGAFYGIRVLDHAGQAIARAQSVAGRPL